MATEIVADASALLAYIFGEPGGTLVEPWLARGAVGASAVNVAETVTKLQQLGGSYEESWRNIQMLDIAVFDFTLEIARASTRFASLAKMHGISFADRACVATATVVRLPVLTADRKWPTVFPKGLDIRTIR